MGPSLHSKHLLEQVTSALSDCVSALQFATDPATLLIPVLGPRVITTVLTGTLNHPHAFVWAASPLTAEAPLQTGSFTNTENMFVCPCSFGICRMGSTQWTWLNEWKEGGIYLLQGKILGCKNSVSARLGFMPQAPGTRHPRPPLPWLWTKATSTMLGAGRGQSTVGRAYWQRLWKASPFQVT